MSEVAFEEQGGSKILGGATMFEEWDKTSWRLKNVDQMPQWDTLSCKSVNEELSQLPSLVFAGEIRKLMEMLKNASIGKAFVLQCGNCAEEFSDCHGPKIHKFLKLLLQMSFIISCVGGKKVVKIGRIAGQYAKPRSKDTELVGDVLLPSYRGDMVNSVEPNPEARTPNPRRIIDGYFRSAATLNLIRAFMQGGYGEIENARGWHATFSDFFGKNPKYISLVDKIRDFMRFSEVFLDGDARHFGAKDVFTSHEALLLDYEEALTRFDTTEGGYYDTSAHMLWVGERTRHPDHAHIEFLRGISNPVGVKIGPGHLLEDLQRVFSLLNSKNQGGKLALITRFGSSRIRDEMPKLVELVKKNKNNVLWLCDPMHGNTYVNNHSRKTRSYNDIIDEIDTFFDILYSFDEIPGGLHLELTADNVTECIGGPQVLTDVDLSSNYLSSCDPRLNFVQALDLSFHVAQILNAHES